MATFVGVRVDGVCTVYRLEPPLCSIVKPTSKVYRQPKPGLEWGYRGAGPAELALAIMLDVTEDKDVAELLFQRFKHEVIALLPRAGWIMEGEYVEDWILRQIAPPVQPIDDTIDLGREP